MSSNNQNKFNVFLLHLCNKIEIMKKNIFIAFLCLVSIACISNNIYLRNKESLEIENLERQVEYEKTMHSIDSTEQMRIIQNYESLIQIIQK